MPSKRLLVLPAAAVAAGVAAAGWVALRRRDERAVEADPEHAELSRDPSGRPLAVRSADGTVLHAEVFGPEPASTIVLVHGWIADRRYWHYQIRDLAPDYRLVAYDQRGHGRSRSPEGDDYSADALGADLDAVLRDCVPAGEPVVVVGQSMGAMAAVAWAGDHADQVPARVAGAVLMNTGVVSLVREAKVVRTATALAGAREAVGRRVLGMAMPWPRRSDPLFGRALRWISMGPHATPAQVAFCQRLLLACPADVRAAFGVTLAGLDLLDALEALRKVPVTVVVGAEDRLTPPVHGQQITEALPHADLVTLPEVGHMAPIEAHDDVTALIRKMADRTLSQT